MNLDADLEQRLKQLNEVFLEENTKLNLSALRTTENCWYGNVLDSLPLLDVLPTLTIPNSPSTILDIGTGGGFPLLPLAIALPEARLTGLDSTEKKLNAISRIADQLELNNVQLICSRAEDLGRNPEHREQYDIVTARAVAPLNTLLEYASPFVKPGGYFIAWKSLKIDQELEESLLARAELSMQILEPYVYDLDEEWPANRSPEGGGWGERQLLLFKKRAQLSDKYPREVGVPKKEPLL